MYINKTGPCIMFELIPNNGIRASSVYPLKHGVRNSIQGFAITAQSFYLLSVIADWEFTTPYFLLYLGDIDYLCDI